MRDRTPPRAALLLLAASALLAAAPARATVGGAAAIVAPLSAAATLRVTDIYARTGCLVKMHPARNCSAAPVVAWFAEISRRCTARVAAVAAGAGHHHAGCAAVDPFVCYGAATCGNRTLMAANSTLAFGFDYVTWQVALTATPGVQYAVLAAPSAALRARAASVHASSVAGVSLGVFAEGLLLNYSVDASLAARTAPMGFSFNITDARGVLTSRYVTNRRATEALCLARMDVDAAMTSARIFTQNTRMCGSFVKHAIHAELNAFDAAYGMHPGVCTATEKEAAKMSKCLRDADVPLKDDLPGKAAAPGAGYCDDKGVQERVRCLPKCACKGGASNAAHVEQYRLLGNVVFPGRAPCFDNTTTFDSLCGKNNSAKGLNGGAIFGIVFAVVVVLALLGGAAYVLIRRRQQRQRDAADGLDAAANEGLVTEQGTSGMYTHHRHYHPAHFEDPHSHSGHHASHHAHHHAHHGHPSFHAPHHAA